MKNYNNKTVEIEAFQSTFMILKIENRLFRFNFINKKEAFLRQKEIGKLTFHQHHPLLINYNEGNLEVFINSIEEITQGWRSWKDYIEIDTGINYKIFLQNIQEGSGKLFKVPFSIIKNIENTCLKHDVSIIYFGDKKITQNQLIMINNQFVISEKFNVDIIQG